MRFPDSKKFAFTIIDDTDYAYLNDIKPIYDTLFNLGFKTTRAICPLKPSNGHFEFYGDTLEEEDHRDYMLELHDKGFEMALHSVTQKGYRLIFR